ncbi:MAG: hypothetical protein JWQ27_3300 [Ferruginibacter sp.]|nr:hypothetical protein [Ferruginibacter sp.]
MKIAKAMTGWQGEAVNSLLSRLINESYYIQIYQILILFSGAMYILSPG